MFELIELEKSLDVKSELYSKLLINIKSSLPEIKEACRNFGKTQSQFMDNFLTVSHPTPLRNARQILAEMNKSIEALKEAQYKMSKKKIQIKKLEAKLLNVDLDPFDQEEAELKVHHLKTQIETTLLYVEGAIRSISNYNEQYKQVLESAGYSEMSEEAFEAEEEAYHIMKAFEQAICAARSRGGSIDEGNHIYFSQIGVNGALAQECINQFFKQERLAIETGHSLTAAFQFSFLKDMESKFKGCSLIVAKEKGIAPVTESALLKANQSKVKELRRKV